VRIIITDRDVLSTVRNPSVIMVIITAIMLVIKYVTTRGMAVNVRNSVLNMMIMYVAILNVTPMEIGE